LKFSPYSCFSQGAPGKTDNKKTALRGCFLMRNSECGMRQTVIRNSQFAIRNLSRLFGFPSEILKAFYCKVETLNAHADLVQNNNVCVAPKGKPFYGRMQAFSEGLLPQSLPHGASGINSAGRMQASSGRGTRPPRLVEGDASAEYPSSIRSFIKKAA